MSVAELRVCYENAAAPSERMDLVESILENGILDWEGAALFAQEILISDPNAIVRHEAAFVLGELRRRSLIGETAGEESLCRAASMDPSIVVRHEAAEALYCFPGKRAERVLEELLLDPSEDVRLTAEISLSWRQKRRR